jgi:hypothetical protein
MRVQLSVHGDGERWVRMCAGSSFSSIQRPAAQGPEPLLSERFGPVAVDMSLRVKGSSLHYAVRRWSFFGIPMPRAWGPRSTAVEAEQDGAFKFDVEVGLPIAGLIVRYTGVLTPES